MTGNAAKVSSVACPAAGECTALGYYSTNGSFNRLFVVRESHGRWGKAEPVPGLGGIDSSGVLACPSADNCGVAGAYSAGSSTRAFVVNEKEGVWGVLRRGPELYGLGVGKDNVDRAEVTAGRWSRR